MFRRTSILFSILLLCLTTTAFAQDGDEEQRERVRVRGVNPNFAFFVPMSGGYLGVGMTSLTPELRRHFGVPEDQGVMVSSVREDSPASRAGLRVGDIIVAVDASEVQNGSHLQRIIRGYEEGDLAEVQFFRDGQLESTTATIVERERRQVDLSGMMHGLEELERLEGLEHLGENIGEVTALAMESAARALEQAQVEIDSEMKAEMERAMVEAREVMEDARFQERIRRVEEIETRELERQLEKMERRLRELEKRLEDEGGTPE